MMQQIAHTKASKIIKTKIINILKPNYISKRQMGIIDADYLISIKHKHIVPLLDEKSNISKIKFLQTIKETTLPEIALHKIPDMKDEKVNVIKSKVMRSIKDKSKFD